MSAGATQSGEWTVGRLLNWTRDYLEGKGLDQPKLCAQLLLAHALGCERLELYLRFEAAPEPTQLDAFRDLVRRAAAGEPIAYLIGRKEFFSLEFLVTPDVLIPRAETETLVETVLHIARAADAPITSVLDLCTGCGCVGAALASQLPDIRVAATDVSAEALRVAGVNVERHGLADRIALIQGDLFDPLAAGQARFDVIAANPPYVKTDHLASLSADVSEYEPRVALDGGRDGLDVIRRIVPAAPAWLNDGGWVALEIGYDQASAVRALFEDAGLTDVRSVEDSLGHERVFVGRSVAQRCPSTDVGQQPSDDVR